jgi:hypothetical protein
MSRRIGAHADWTFPPEIVGQVRAMEDRVGDLSVAMEKVSKVIFEDVVDHLRSHQGEGAWPAHAATTVERHGEHELGVGEHGGFVPTLRRDWTSHNAVAFTRAPHAHLFSGGTQQYHGANGRRVSRWGSRKDGRVSRSKAKLGGRNARIHQPGRMFDYLSQQARERATGIVVTFVSEGETPS